MFSRIWSITGCKDFGTSDRNWLRNSIAPMSWRIWAAEECLKKCKSRYFTTTNNFKQAYNLFHIYIYIYVKLMVFLNNQFLFTFDNLKRRWRTSPCFEGFGKLNHSMSLIMRWRSLTRSESHTKLCSNFERRFSRLLTLISSKLWPYKNKNIHIKKWIKMNKSWNHCISIFNIYQYAVLETIKGDNMVISTIIPENYLITILNINIKNLHV